MVFETLLTVLQGIIWIRGTKPMLWQLLPYKRWDHTLYS